MKRVAIVNNIDSYAQRLVSDGLKQLEGIKIDAGFRDVLPESQGCNNRSARRKRAKANSKK